MSIYAKFIVCYMWMLVTRLCSAENYVDLSYDVDENSAHWPSGAPFNRTAQYRGYTPKGYWFEEYYYCMGEHTGTHLDAPSHFAEGKWSTDEIPFDHLIGPGVVIDIKEKVSNNHTAELSTDDLMDWLNEHGPLPNGVIIFVRTGWSSRYGNRKEYYGTETSDTGNLVFPGIGTDAAQFIVGYEAANGKKIVGVGIDAPSQDHGPSKTFKTHQTLSKANIYGIENLANLDTLPATGFQVMVMPTKIRGGSGGPARVVATVPATCAAPHPNTLGTPLLLTVLAVLCSVFQLNDH